MAVLEISFSKEHRGMGKAGESCAYKKCREQMEGKAEMGGVEEAWRGGGRKLVIHILSRHNT